MRPWVVVAVAPIGFHEEVGRLAIARAWTQAGAVRVREQLGLFAPRDGWLEICHRRDWRTPIAQLLNVTGHRRRRARYAGAR